MLIAVSCNTKNGS